MMQGYGNLPPSMYRRGTGTTEPAKPLAPEGRGEKSSPMLTGVPDGKREKLNPRVKEGKANSKRQPMLNGVPDGNASKLMPRTAEGNQNSKKQPKRGGVPMKANGATPRAKKSKNGGAKPDKSDGMMSPGNPYSTPKASKKQGFTASTYHM